MDAGNICVLAASDRHFLCISRIQSSHKAEELDSSTVLDPGKINTQKPVHSPADKEVCHFSRLENAFGGEILMENPIHMFSGVQLKYNPPPFLSCYR